MNDVILFLTSANDSNRKELTLKNLHQLSKLNKDIIILSTTSNVDPRFYSLAKCVIIDENKNTFSKSLYKKIDNYHIPAYTPKNVMCNFTTHTNYKTKLYSETNYLNVFKNTKNLIRYAIAQDYNSFLYIEDDHYFSDYGINVLHDLFNQIKDLNAIYFTETWSHDIIRSHFWFGKCKYFQESILNNFPESIEDINSIYPYFSLYELFLYTKMYYSVYNKDRIKMISFNDGGFNKLFGNDSVLNQVNFLINIKDDVNCNIIYNYIDNAPSLFFNFLDTQLDNQDVHFELYKNDILIYERLINTKLEKTTLYPISIDGTIKVKLNSVEKVFNLSLKDVILNGSIN